MVFHVQQRLDFPNLNHHNYVTTSPADVRYNCIAWAAGDTQRWWWPDQWGQYFWPPGIPREQTVEAFLQAFEIHGYAVCADSTREPEFEKVALYALNGVPKHAARQLPSGRWTSKCGINIDMEHDFNALDGPAYGTAVRFLRKRVGAVTLRP